MGPRDEIVETPPPGFYLVKAFFLRRGVPASCFVIELDRIRSMYLIANEARGLIHEMSPLLEAVLEVDLVGFRYAHSVGDDDHSSSNHEAGAKARALRLSPRWSVLGDQSPDFAGASDP